MTIEPDSLAAVFGGSRPAPFVYARTAEELRAALGAAASSGDAPRTIVLPLGAVFTSPGGRFGPFVSTPGVVVRVETEAEARARLTTAEHRFPGPHRVAGLREPDGVAVHMPLRDVVVTPLAPPLDAVDAAAAERPDPGFGKRGSRDDRRVMLESKTFREPRP